MAGNSGENNSDNKALKTLKDVANKIKNFFVNNSKFIIIAMVAVILVIVIIAGGYLIILLDDVKNSNDTSSSSYSKYNSKAYSNSLSVDTETGTITSSDEEYDIENIWEEDDRYSEYICGIEVDGEELEAFDVFEYLWNAEVVMQYPYIEGLDEDSLNGTVCFYRYIDGDEVQLQFKSTTEFDSMVSSGDEDVLSYFTINEDGSIKIAYLEEASYTIETDDPEGLTALQAIDSDLDEDASSVCQSETLSSSNGQYSVTVTESTLSTTNISYKSKLEKYVLPFNLLWSIIVIGNGDKTEAVSLAYAIAEMAYNGEISLIIDDNNVQTTDVTTYNYTLTDHYNGEITATVKKYTSTYTKTIEHKIDTAGVDHKTTTGESTSEPRNTSTTPETSKTLTDQKVDIGTYATVYTEWHSVNTVALDIKKIESWCAIYENDATYTSSDSGFSDSNISGGVDTETEEVDIETFTISSSSDIDELISDGVDNTYASGEETVADWRDNIENTYQDYDGETTSTYSDYSVITENGITYSTYTETQKTPKYTYDIIYGGEVIKSQNYTNISYGTSTRTISSRIFWRNC